MYDAILVPTDGSDHATTAARHALGLAARFDATVHVLAVVDVQGAAGPFDAGGISGDFVDRLDDRAGEWLDAVAALAAADQRVETEIVHGKPRKAIPTYAEDHDVDLLAMGTHGRSGIRRFIAGSVTEHVLRSARVPVLTATDRGAEPDTEYDRVLVPTDGSDCAGVAVDHGLAIAEATGATVHALFVVDANVIAAQPEVAPGTRILDHLKEEGATATAAVAERARDRGLAAETAVMQGSPAKTLLGYADDQDVDLIAMGTHGRSGFDRLVLGSTTERTVRQAEVPVVAVPGRPPEQS